jgi:hypothetical protein
MSLSDRFSRLANQKPKTGTLVQPFPQGHQQPIIRQPFPHQQSSSTKQLQLSSNSNTIQSKQQQQHQINVTLNRQAVKDARMGKHMANRNLQVAPSKHGWEYNPDARQVGKTTFDATSVAGQAGNKNKKIAARNVNVKKTSVMDRLNGVGGNIEQRLTHLKPITERLTFPTTTQQTTQVNAGPQPVTVKPAVGKFMGNTKPKNKNKNKKNRKPKLTSEVLDQDLDTYMSEKPPTES